jgi:uncharacterized protein (DUF305 family)
MKSISQSNVLFTFIGGVVGVGFMAGLMMFTDLGKEHMRDMDMSIGNEVKDRVTEKMRGMHMMADGTVMKNADTDMTDMTMSQMSLMMVGKTGNDLDLAFLEGMIPHHEGAVEMAKVMLKGTARPEMKDFARDIISAQSAEIAKMKAWQSAWSK